MYRCLATLILAVPLPVAAGTGTGSLPSSLALLGVGLACLALLMYRRG